MIRSNHLVAKFSVICKMQIKWDNVFINTLNATRIAGNKYDSVPWCADIYSALITITQHNGSLLAQFISLNAFYIAVACCINFVSQHASTNIEAAR